MCRPSSPGVGGRFVILVEAGDDAEVGAALGAVVLGLAAEDAAALIYGVPAEVAAERRAGAHGGRVARPRRRLALCRAAVRHRYGADKHRAWLAFLTLQATVLES